MNARGAPRASRPGASMESRLGHDTLRHFHRAVIIRSYGMIMALLGSLVTIAAARFVSETASYIVGSFVVSTVVVMGVASFVSMRRAIRLLVTRFGLPPAYASTVLDRTFRDERAFDEWLARCRPMTLNRQASSDDDTPVLGRRDDGLSKP